MPNYEPVIGLEIHCELKTKSKMFCSCANDPFTAEPNANVCPICLGFPGTLPVPNKRAIELTLAVGKALQCKPVKESKFDRKNYFYPDLPKGYQISQYDLPLMEGGSLTVEGRAVGVRRVHLEEDTGKNIHKVGESSSLVDYNRAGVPLIEMVTEPDITSPKLASAFAKELQQILRYAGASNADMEKGEMRVEANVSVRRRTDTSQQSTINNQRLGTKVEIKNLNSFRAVEQAIAYELSRQEEILKSGGKIIQETRGWSETKGATFSQRTKEEAEDYRYFPEPDIPPLAVAEWKIELPALPDQVKEEILREGISPKLASVMVAEPALIELWRDYRTKGRMTAVEAANWMVNQGVPTDIDRPGFFRLLDSIAAREITSSQAKEILKEAKETKKVVIPEGVQVISDRGELATIIEEVLSQNSAAVADVKAGKSEAIGFLVGQVMAKTQGHADPKLVHALLKRKLG